METTALGKVSKTARGLLAAARTQDVASLERWIERAEQLAREQDGTETQEQAELIGAVASEMRGAISRMKSRAVPGLEGAEVHFRLLRHAAGFGQVQAARTY